jgi:tetratricopeptide (TPR) repeat protein
LASTDKQLFISRAGADAAFSAEIGLILEEAGYGVLLQQWDFANANFMEQMHAALSGGARVVALLSPEYLASDHCQAEWQNAIAGDPLNKNRRLVLLRVAECEPSGLLAGLAYWDLVPIRDNRPLLAEIVRTAVGENRRAAGAEQGPYWREPRVVLDRTAVQPMPNFTGRDDELAAIAAAFRDHDRVAIVGLGGMGKSSLAREYAWRGREGHAIVWWLDAETEDGIIDGLVALGSLFVRGLEQVANRADAAKQVITSMLGGFSKPILFVFDNLEDERLLRAWQPSDRANVLITSRAAHWGGDIVPIVLGTWSSATATIYLHRESGRVDLSEADSQQLAAALDGLPLALAHAAAYLRNTQTVTAQSYLARLGRHLALAPRHVEYPQAVFATFRAAIAKAESESPGAAAVLCLASLCAPDEIPEELFGQLPDVYPENLRPILPEALHPAQDLRSTVAEPVSVEEALGALDRLSLVAFTTATRSFTVHRLVQAAARDLAGEALEKWAEATVAALGSLFPDGTAPGTMFASWPRCEQLLPHARVALDMLPASTTFLPAARLLVSCGIYLEERAAFGDAERLLRRALVIRESVLGLEHAEVAFALERLASILHHTDRMTEAELLYLRALSIIEATLGPEHHDTAQTLNDLATMLVHMDRFAEAEPLFRRSLAIVETISGPEHPDVASVLNNIGFVLHYTDRITEVEPIYRRALAIREASLRPDDPKVAGSVLNLATYLRDSGRLEEAEPLILRALAIHEAGQGAEHPDIALALVNLAILYRMSGRFVDQEVPLRRALAIQEAGLGPEHRDTATTLYNLALLHRDTGRPAEAERFLRRALAIREKSLGAEHRDTIRTRDELEASVRETNSSAPSVGSDRGLV